MEPLYNCFVAFQLPAGCHVTITKARNVTAQRVEEMRKRWKTIVAIQKYPSFVIGNYCKLGADLTMDAYKCKPQDKVLHRLLKDFHRDFYEPSPQKRCYPDLKTHITVDTPERLFAVEDMIRGPQKSVVISLGPIFEARNKEEDERNAQVDDRAWTCVQCNNRNPKEVRECVGNYNGVPCSQWRPKKAMYDDAPHRTQSAAVLPEYAAPPSAPPLASIPSQQPKRRRYQDWNCPRCGEDDIFGSRDKCHKCGANRPSSVPAI